MTHAVQHTFEGRPEDEEAVRRAIADGETVEDRQIVNYFAEPETFRFDLGDGQQYFEYRPLTESGKARYENATTNDVRVQRGTGDSKFRVDQATERQALVMLSVVDARIYGPSKSTGQLVELKFEPCKNAKVPNDYWQRIFNAFPPKIIQDLYKDIRKQNPWMNQDQDLEAMEEEYKNLGERIEAAKEEQAKN